MFGSAKDGGLRSSMERPLRMRGIVQLCKQSVILNRETIVLTGHAGITLNTDQSVGPLVFNISVYTVMFKKPLRRP